MSSINAIRNPEGIWINSQVFREEALAFKKNGYYCPDLPNSYGWLEYWDEQLRRCREGYTVGGVSITGHHYFYLNFVEIMLVSHSDNERVARKISEPPAFWDGDYEYFWTIEIARNGSNREFVDRLQLECIIDDQYLNGGYHVVVGKEQPHSCKIMTPNGFTTMGEIKINDIVCTPTGTAKVLDKYYQGSKDVYEITLFDGRKTRCGIDHLWEVYSPSYGIRNNKQYRKKEVITTKSLLEKELVSIKSKNKIYNYYLRNNDEIEHSKKELSIPPYTLGCILGDGNVTKQFKISGIDEELFDFVINDLNNFYGENAYKKGSRYEANLNFITETKNNIVYDNLRKLDLNCKSIYKFIPDNYKYSSIEDRYELVKGLMDTDGSITKDGSISFSNISIRLVKDLQEVLSSLGILSTLRSRKDGMNILYINSSKPIFKLTRKLNRLRNLSHREFTPIINIKKLDYQEESSCIHIDSKDHLYLTDDYIVTHNSRRKGYQQPYSETIITPNGKTTMGNIKVGDCVSTPDGKAKVLEKYEQGECDVYEITLQDGRKVRCGKEHLWKTKDHCVIDTSKIIEFLTNNNNVFIPSYSKLTNREFDKIVNVKKLDYKEQSACILIDSDDHLYLTTDFIVTHNSYKNAAICTNIINTIPDSLVIIGAYEKKFLYPTGTMGMTSKYLDHINGHTAWTKAREFVDKQEHRKLSYRRIRDGATIEEGYKSEVIALTFQDNPDAARGKDARLILFEEAGKFPNLVDSYMATKETLGAGKFSTGQMIIFGCVCAGTKVYTNDGKVVNIEDLKQEDGIVGYNGEKAVQQNINWFKPPAKKDCYRISFNDNSYIECSHDHPLLLTKRKFVRNKKKRLIYQEAKYIEINDQVITPSEIPLFGNKNISYARELGLMIGDGNYSLNTTPSLSISEIEILEYIINKYDLKYSHYYKTKNNDDYYQYSLPQLKDKLINHKMYGQVKQNKRLPYDIHTFNKTSLANLLAGYFDADGNIYYNKKKEIVRIVLTSISYDLLEEVKYQLLKFGIHSNVYKENRNTLPSEEYKGQKDYICRLYINKQTDIELFKNNILLLVDSKREKLNLIKHSKYDSFDGLFEINPLNNKEGYFNSNTIKNLRYKTVTSIEHIGEKEVYNLNCGPNHNYISNGLITRQTGGDMESGTVDFARMFYNPEEFDLMPFENIWDHNARGTKCGFFHADYKNLEGYYDEQGNSDIEEARNYENETRDKLRKNASSVSTLQKRIQERPHRPSEAFLVVSVNDFPVQELQEQLNRVERENLHLKKGQPVYLERNDDLSVRSTPILDNKISPLWEYNIKQEDITGCPIIYEYPINNAPSGLYKIGYDPYRQDQATNSTSLGAVYVYKGFMRGQSTYDCIVASYIGRPNTSDDFHRNLEMLAELYNAEIGYENEVTSVKSYFERRKKLHLLALQPEAVINANIKKSKVSRTFGIHMVEKIKDAGEKYIKQWLLTEKSIDENGKTLINLQTIYDPGLLKELILYNRKGNFDRVMAFMILQMYLENEEENKVHESNNYDVIKEMDAFANNIFKR